MLYPRKTIVIVMKSVHIRLPEKLLKEMDRIINQGLYSDRSEFIRGCIRAHVEMELWKED